MMRTTVLHRAVFIMISLPADKSAMESIRIQAKRWRGFTFACY